MNKTRLMRIVSSMMTIRHALSEYLPVKSNLVFLDILMFVLSEHFQDNPLTIKRLFLSLDLSHTGFRYHFRKLVDDDWVKLSKITEENADQRLRFVTPSDKLISQMLLMTDVIDHSPSRKRK